MVVTTDQPAVDLPPVIEPAVGDGPDSDSGPDSGPGGAALLRAEIAALADALEQERRARAHDRATIDGMTGRVAELEAMVAERDARIAEFGALRAECERKIRETEAAIREREGQIAALGEALDQHARRADRFQADIDRMDERLEHARIKTDATCDRLVHLEASLEEALVQHRRLDGEVADARKHVAQALAGLKERDAEIARLRRELERRGRSGSRQALRTALVDLLRTARERRRRRLAVGQPWRLPPARRH